MGTPLSAKNFFSQDLRKKGPVESFPNFSKNLLLKPIQAYNLVEFFKILQPHKSYRPRLRLSGAEHKEVQGQVTYQALERKLQATTWKSQEKAKIQQNSQTIQGDQPAKSTH